MQTKILVLGSTGLLGLAFKHIAQNYNFDFVFPTREELDLLDFQQLKKFIQENPVNFIINCAGLNDVKAIETDDSSFDLALALNADLPYELAKLSKIYKFRLISFSSDYVFDGTKHSYAESDIQNPINRYGLTKAIGEKLALSLDAKVSIFRTAWLFGPFKKNFVSTIVNQAIENQPLKIVADQFGSPTFTIDIAEYILSNLDSHQNGIFHLVNNGRVSWYDLARMAFIILNLSNSILKLSTKDFSSPVNRPLNSSLNSYDINKLRPLEQALQDYLTNYEL